MKTFTQETIELLTTALREGGLTVHLPNSSMQTDWRPMRQKDRPRAERTLEALRERQRCGYSAVLK